MMNKLRELKGGSFTPIAPQQPNKQELTGQIISKERKIVYKKNEFNGNTYFRLKMLEPNKEKPSILFVYSNIVSKQIFNDIENSTYIYKQYLSILNYGDSEDLRKEYQEYLTNPKPIDNNQQKEQLQQEISNLTNKPNKTPQEEQKLADKQAQLDKLTKPTNNNEQNNGNSWLMPTLIIGGSIIIVIGVIYLLNKKKHNKRK